MTKHLVLGGAGFLGRHVACALGVQGCEVTVADRSILPATLAAQFRIECRTIDLFALTIDQLRDLIAPHDVVHHYVWTTVPASANAAPFDDLHDNVGFTIRLLEAASLQRKRVLFCSSGGTVYGQANIQPIPENANLDPLTAYGVSKVAAEKYCGYFRAMRGVDAVVARLANPYGAGQSRTRLQGVVTRSAHLALSGETIEIWGDGSVVRDYIYVWDAAEALCRIAVHDAHSEDTLPVFNVGGGRGASVTDVLSALSCHFAVPPKLNYTEQRSFDVKANVLDISRVHNMLGWSPRTALERGIELLVADLRRDPDGLLASRP